MGNYTIFQMFENPRRGRQARNFTTKCSENSRSQIRTNSFRKLTLGAPDQCSVLLFYVFYSKLLKAARKEKKLKQGLEVTAANQLNCYTKNMHIIYSLLNIFIQNLSHLVNMVLAKDILDYCKTIFFILYTWS